LTAVITSGFLIVWIALPATGFAEDGETYEQVLGVWDTVTQTPSGPVEGELKFELVGGELKITEATYGPADEVAYSDGALSFVLEIDGRRYSVVADVEGGTLDGKVFVGGTSFCNYEEMYEYSGTRRP
jgi:hypothetical protein